LRSVINMHVNGTFFSKGVFGVVHVLSCINLVELSLSIGDLEGIVSRVLLVLAEISTDKGSVSLRSVVVEGEFKDLGHSEERKDSPSNSHLTEVVITDHKFSRQPVASEPRHTLNASMGFPKSGEVPSILVWHVGRQKEFETSLILESVIPVETIILNLTFMEPRSSRLLGNTAEVTHRAHFIQHILFIIITII
jgi:hypothetical protein